MLNLIDDNYLDITKLQIPGTKREQCPLDVPRAFDDGQRCCPYDQDVNGNLLAFDSVTCKDNADVPCLKQRCISNGEMFKYCYKLKLKRINISSQKVIECNKANTLLQKET